MGAERGIGRRAERYPLCALVMFAGINALYMIKYASRLSPAAAAVGTAVYAAFMAFAGYRYLRGAEVRRSGTKAAVIAALYIVLSAVALTQVSKYGLHVDRWKIVKLFWDAVAEGHCPYAVTTPYGNYVGPMPFYHILCWPWHYIGEMGIATLLALAAMLYAVYRTAQRESGGQEGGNALLFATVVTVTSPAVMWEILARSTVIYNSVFFYILLLYLSRFNSFNKCQYIVTAIAAGLLASTRVALAMSFVIWGVYMLRQRTPFVRIALWAAVALASFALTFLPLLIAYGEEFIEMNPFVVQSSLTNGGEVLIFTVLAVVTGLLPKSHRTLMFWLGAYFTAIITINFTGCAVQFSLHEALFMSEMDISYFLFAFPFLTDSMAVITRNSVSLLTRRQEAFQNIDQ